MFLHGAIIYNTNLKSQDLSKVHSMIMRRTIKILPYKNEPCRVIISMMWSPSVTFSAFQP